MSVRGTLAVVGAIALTTVAVVLAPAQTALAGQGPAAGPPPATSTQGGTAPAGPAAAPAPRVDAVYRTSDGVSHGTSYLAAPGVTADQLYQLLAAQGVQGLTAPVAGAGAPGSCGYGSASDLVGGCPTVGWARNGYTNPQIYYHDMSGSSWPEGTVISEWNNSANIHVAWAPGGCPGYGGTHCVPVWDGYQGANGYEAVVSYDWDGADHFIDGSVSIDFNDSYSTNHRVVACAETGVTVGMGGNSSGSSCLYYGSATATWPNSDDYNELLYEIYPR
ncbi:hypothetical protein [Streptacidiphilus sp. EB129]|uniref:hypothetical protein n=1 Tax=Streptacidiphilus sp. EB129 TaxID=3156262 RepID=UPI003514CC9F